MDLHSTDSKPFIIPIFLPHTGCPHRCVFCDQSAITGQKAALPHPELIRREIFKFLSYNKRRRTPVQISFYGGNFLGQPEKTVRRLLDIASEYIESSDVDSIRFSTRPDTIDPARLGWLAGYRVATVELGVQSMVNAVLQNAKRGHTARDTENAMTLLKDAGYETGLQMMLGLPGDSVAGALETGRRILELNPNFVRIYPALVLADSPLADRFTTGRYTPLSLETAVDITGQLYRLFVNGSIRVIRMGLQASASLNQDTTILAGPYHPAFGQLVISKLFLDCASLALGGVGKYPDTISIAVNPRSVSNLKGQKNRNLERLQRRFPDHRFEVQTNPVLDETEIAVNGGKPVSILAST
ncbi:MAG: radical SAM protein [Desulfobacterales bacterium]|nr:radical SAM protein [Desulfobacterales bacterium]